jgi:hypothetical protein
VEKKDNILNFLSYIKTPLSENSIAVLYSANDIKYEKCQLFSDFVQSLIMLVFDTYMGDDITSDGDKVNHFRWCWEKNIINFKEEGIHFADTDDSFNYFLEFMLEVYYKISHKDEKQHIPITIRALWLSVFSYHRVKTRSDMDNFIEVYKILDKSLKKGQKKVF